MGLDITVYQKLNRCPNDDCPTIDDLDFDDLPYDENITALYINQDFKEQADDILHNWPYTYADRFTFRAGSYGGYNEWRDQLARMAGYLSARDVWEKDTDGPFTELINFSDCEGVIGPKTSYKLYLDFSRFQSAADEIGGYFLEKYNDWRRAFEMASDNGAVEFH